MLEVALYTGVGVSGTGQERETTIPWQSYQEIVEKIGAHNVEVIDCRESEDGQKTVTLRIHAWHVETDVRLPTDEQISKIRCAVTAADQRLSTERAERIAFLTEQIPGGTMEILGDLIQESIARRHPPTRCFASRFDGNEYWYYATPTEKGLIDDLNRIRSEGIG